MKQEKRAKVEQLKWTRLASTHTHTYTNTITLARNSCKVFLFHFDFGARLFVVPLRFFNSMSIFHLCLFMLILNRKSKYIMLRRMEQTHKRRENRYLAQGYWE